MERRRILSDIALLITGAVGGYLANIYNLLGLEVRPDSSSDDTYSDEADTQTETPDSTSTESSDATSTPTETASSDISASWPMYQADVANTGFIRTDNGSTSGNVKWTYSVGGKLGSSPIVVNGKVIIGTPGGEVHAIDADSGSQRWTFDTGALVQTISYRDGSLYFGNNNGEIFSISPQGGKEQWSKDIGSSATQPPAVTDELALFSKKGAAVAVSPDTGEVLWEFPVLDQDTARVALHDKKAFITNPHNNTVHAVTIGSGNEEWKFSVENGIVFGMPPTVAENSVFMGNDQGYAYSIDEKTGELNWRVSPGEDVFRQSFAYRDGKVYFGRNDRTFYCLDASTGESIWSFSDDLPNDRINHDWTAPVINNEIVYTGYHTGTVFALDADTGTEKWRLETDGNIQGSSPAVTKSSVYICSWDGNLYAIE